MSNSTLLSLTDRAGTDLGGQTSFSKIMKVAGFDFETVKVPAFFKRDGKTHKGAGFQVVRTDTDVPLGHVGNDYKTLQNEDVFGAVHRVGKDHGAEASQAGFIDDGATCWLTYKLPDSIKLKKRAKDVTDIYLLGLNNHSGLFNAMLSSFGTRVFCNNQLPLITSKSGKAFCYKIRHTTSGADRLKLAEQAFKRAVKDAKEYGRLANHLDDQNFSQKQMEGFAAALFPATPNKKGDTPTRTQNMRDEIVELFSTGFGNIGKTKWDALNAVTEYVDHHRATRVVENSGRSKAQNQFQSGLLPNGSGSKIKERAIQLLMA